MKPASRYKHPREKSCGARAGEEEFSARRIPDAPGTCKPAPLNKIGWPERRRPTQSAGWLVETDPSREPRTVNTGGKLSHHRLLPDHQIEFRIGPVSRQAVRRLRPSRPATINAIRPMMGD